MKQIGLGIMQYTQDYDEKFPLQYYTTVTNAGWASLIQPYVRSTQLLQCPSDPVSGSDNPLNTGYNDYAWNAAMSSQNGAMSVAQLEYAANTICVTEGYLNYPSYQIARIAVEYPDFWGAIYGTAPGPVANFKSGLNRHLDGSNYAFADGHAKWLKPSVIPNTGQYSAGPAPTGSNVAFQPYAGAPKQYP
jgi:prepilin-type processing-associated H-X9-DG protein